MSGFDESKVRRGQPDNAGQFREHTRSAPDAQLDHPPVDLTASDALKAAERRFLDSRAVYERELIREMRRIAPPGAAAIVYEWDGEDLNFSHTQDADGEILDDTDSLDEYRDTFYTLGFELRSGASRTMRQSGNVYTLDVVDTDAPVGLDASRRRLEEALDRFQHVAVDHPDFPMAANEVEDAAHQALKDLAHSGGIRNIVLDWSDQGEFMTVTEAYDAEGNVVAPGEGGYTYDLFDELDVVASNITDPSRNFVPFDPVGRTYALNLEQGGESSNGPGM